jgi:hypothetical protein
MPGAGEHCLSLTVIAAHIDRQRAIENIIHIAITPIFAWFERLDHRVTGGVKMLGGVFILRLVAAADVATGFTKA